MVEFLSGVDVAIFRFLNQTLANPVTDVLMPFLTDLTSTWFGRILVGGVWLLLIVRGGKPGRAAAIILVPVIAVSDQLSSNLLKGIFLRPRPCHTVDGVAAVEGVRLLVGCGGGMSFPSSHAVNHFAAATWLRGYYPKAAPYLFAYASIIALSRVFVGVHYPADLLGGALIGAATGWAFHLAWRSFRKLAPPLGPYGPAPRSASPGVP